MSTEQVDKGDQRSSSEEIEPGKSEVSRRNVLKSAAGAGAVSTLAGCLGGIAGGGSSELRVGILSALSQGWGSSGRAFLRGAEIHFKQIGNEVEGMEIKTFVEDTEISPKTTVEKTNKLIEQNNVDVIIGPIASSSRDAMAPIATRNKIPVLYPTQYEGREAKTYCNEWLFKTAEIPVQQINPLIPWLLKNYDGNRFYLIGDDYAWPHAMNSVIKQVAKKHGAKIVGETYVKLGTTEFSSIIPRIVEKNPDFLFSTVTTGAGPLQKQIWNRGHKDKWLSIGLVFNQDLIAGMPPESISGQLSCHAYFELLDNDVNKEMVKAFRNEYGDDALINYLTGTTNAAARFLEQGVKNADGSKKPEDLREAIRGSSVDSPCGPVSIPHDQQMKVGCTAAEIRTDLKLHPVKTFNPVMPEDACDAIP